MIKKSGSIAYALLLLFFFILIINFYLSREHYPPSAIMFLNNPEKYSGKELDITGSVINASQSYFYLSANPKYIKVYYSSLEKPKLGQLNVVGTANADGTITANRVHALSYNYVKYFISFAALILFAVLFFREWKIKKWRLAENA